MGFGKKNEKESDNNETNDNSNIKKAKKDTNGDAEGPLWTGFWILCIIVSILLIVASSFFINDFNKNIKKHNLNYPWP